MILTVEKCLKELVERKVRESSAISPSEENVKLGRRHSRTILGGDFALVLDSRIELTTGDFLSFG
jgi:hypothetical protein